MSFDWKTFLELARDLQHRAGSAVHREAYLRSTVSRAYFGAFGHAINYAKQFLQFHSRELVEDHGRLREHLRRKRRKGDSDRLEQLRQWRNEADYSNDLPWSDPTATVESAVKLADVVFASLVPPKLPP
jgi:hypothetical protein